MKAKFIGLIAGLGFTSGVTQSSAGSFVVDLAQVPTAVQRTINEYLGDGQLRQLLPQNYQGTRIYDAYIKRPGPNRELHIASNGAVLENDPDFLARGAALRMNRLQLSDLPLVVQNAIRTELGAAPIDDIDQETFDGQTVYSIEFQRDRQNHELQVTSDGIAFRDDNIVAVGGASSQSTGTAAAAGRRIELSDLPTDARMTAQREAGGGFIDEIDQITKNGRTFYEATYTRNGQKFRIDIAPDGSLADINGIPLSPSPALVVPGEAIDQIIAGGRKIGFGDLPLGVRNRIRQELNNATIDVFQGVNAGRTVYDVFYDANGQRREMLLANDGTILRNRDLPLVSPAAFVLSAPRRVTLNESPSIVQRTVRTQMGTGSIDKIEEGTWNGRTVYQITLNRDGRREALLVGDDGAVIAPPAVAVIDAGKLNEGLRYPRSIAFNELPLAVQNRLRAEAGSAQISRLERGTVDGRPAYQASYRKSGRQMELRVAEDGSIISNVVAESVLSQP